MTASKHERTKGPWDINPLRTVDNEFMVCGGGTGHDYGLIATVLAEPDAKAIAALPDLIGALEIARVYVADDVRRNPSEYDPRVDLARIDSALSLAKTEE